MTRFSTYVDIGAARHRVDWLKRTDPLTTGTDNDGTPIPTYDPPVTRWMSIRQFRGNELLENQRMVAAATHEFVVWKLDVSPRDQLQFKGRTFNVERVDNSAENGVKSIIWASERL